MKTFFSITFWVVVGGIFGTFIGSSFTHALSESMAPTTLVNDVSFINLLEKPAVGDIIAFSCNTSKCGVTPEDRIGHRLVLVEPNGCMHIEGDNQPDAYDTRDYGCLMPSEVHIIGVEYPLTFINNIFNR